MNRNAVGFHFGRVGRGLAQTDERGKYGWLPDFSGKLLAVGLDCLTRVFACHPVRDAQGLGRFRNRHSDNMTFLDSAAASVRDRHSSVIALSAKLADPSQ